MTEIVTVHFKGGGKQYYFDPRGLTLAPGDQVVVETARGLEFGQCVTGNTEVEETAVVQPLRPVVRLATPEDVETVEQNREREKRAFRICEEKIRHHGLDMKLVEVEYSFEGNKILFFFTAEERVDFRALVKDLAGTLHARIELRQIGVRDEAKMLGGLGICGRPFCCAQFLDEFQPVSIKMAKTQSLSLNPTKISGTCGRLMCCLKYEQEAYEDLVKQCPKAESFVETPDGAGTVTAVSLLRQQVKVRLDTAPESPKTYRSCELRVIRNGKGKRPEGYVQPPLSELEHLRYIPTEEERLAAAEAEEPGLGFRLDTALTTLEMAPTAEPSAEPRREGEGRSRSRRHHRGRGGKGGQGQAQEQQPRPEGEQKAAPRQPAQADAPQQGDRPAGEKKSRSHRRWHRRPKKPGDGGQGGANA